MSVVPTSSRRRLSEYIEHYEGLDYDPDKLHQQHLRARRSIDAPADLSLKFDAHGRNFHLRLRRDLAAFSEDFKVEGSQGQLHDVDTSHIYHGELAEPILKIKTNSIYETDIEQVNSRLNRKSGEVESFSSLARSEHSRTEKTDTKFVGGVRRSDSRNSGPTPIVHREPRTPTLSTPKIDAIVCPHP
ncbi:hypothetical protein HF086_016635 [Spodoptera exigua]|uniref:Peptidase M12B propeptide domain-containing protein n=1 Tax=Spodoptera exigua TaxID=7107 RepID=A0A922SDT6_SPOEX|nr:hypothetical protein HF086_016635 [Spodoptera exigua]